MHKNITQIRDLEVIESELKSNTAGVLALGCVNEKVVQLATPFIYHDKNIYIFFNEENEVFENIHLDDHASFTVIKNGKVKKRGEKDFSPVYTFISVTVGGTIKNVDDNKVIDELRQNYLSKYKKSAEGEINYTELSKVVMLDSEEIQAFEETGG